MRGERYSVYLVLINESTMVQFGAYSVAEGSIRHCLGLCVMV